MAFSDFKKSFGQNAEGKLYYTSYKHKIVMVTELEAAVVSPISSYTAQKMGYYI